MPDNMPETRINIFAQEEAASSAPVPAVRQDASGVEYASFSERLLALLIDVSIIMIPGQFILMNTLGRNIIEPVQLLKIEGLLLAVFILYEGIFSSGGRVTLGKKLMGIAVASADDPERPIGFFRAVVRAIGYFISTAILFLGFFLAFFEERKRTLHDFMARSVVVRLRPKGTVETAAVGIVGAGLMCLFCWTVYHQLFAQGSLLQRSYVYQAEKTLENLSLLQEIHHGKYGYFTNDLQRLVLLSGDPVQFQRDIQASLDRRGFRIGVSQDTYKIVANARDLRRTQVIFIPYRDR